MLDLASLHLAPRWYLGYALDEPLPDHSSLTRDRQRYGVATFRRFFEAVVEQCRGAGLVWGKELYCDATQVNANASEDAVISERKLAANRRDALLSTGPRATAGLARSSRNAVRHGLDARFPVIPALVRRLVAELAATQRHTPAGLLVAAVAAARRVRRRAFDADHPASPAPSPCTRERGGRGG